MWGRIEKRIVEALAQNDFILTFHAERERMPQRNVRRADIVECGRSAKKRVLDSKRGTYKVLGFDLDGDDLTVVVWGRQRSCSGNGLLKGDEGDDKKESDGTIRGS